MSNLSNLVKSLSKDPVTQLMCETQITIMTKILSPAAANNINIFIDALREELNKPHGSKSEVQHAQDSLRNACEIFKAEVPVDDIPTINALINSMPQMQSTTIAALRRMSVANPSITVAIYAALIPHDVIPTFSDEVVEQANRMHQRALMGDESTVYLSERFAVLYAVSRVLQSHLTQQNQEILGPISRSAVRECFVSFAEVDHLLTALSMIQNQDERKSFENDVNKRLVNIYKQINPEDIASSNNVNLNAVNAAERAINMALAQTAHEYANNPSLTSTDAFETIENEALTHLPDDEIEVE